MEELFQHIEVSIKKLVEKQKFLKKANEQLNQSKFIIRCIMIIWF